MPTRIRQEQLDQEKENSRKRREGEWFPTGWWRLMNAKGKIVAESSNESEIRNFAKTEDGGKVQQHFAKHQGKWLDK